MTTFLLVHGAWHDGSAWRPVIDHLRELGHVAYGPTMPGHGNDVDKAVSHDDCVRSIIRFITAENLTDVVLLGHSFGGTIIAQVAEKIPDRLRRMIFWNAFIPEPGNCMLDECPPHYRSLFADLAAASQDNTVMLPFPIWRDAFIQDADIELAQSSYDKLSAEPFQLFTEKLDLTSFYQLKTPRSFLNCTDDIALPPGEWGWHPRMSNRLGLYRLVQMPGSHEVIFTNPEGLASKIVEAGRD